MVSEDYSPLDRPEISMNSFYPPAKLDRYARRG